MSERKPDKTVEAPPLEHIQQPGTPPGAAAFALWVFSFCVVLTLMVLCRYERRSADPVEAHVERLPGPAGRAPLSLEATTMMNAKVNGTEVGALQSVTVDGTEWTLSFYRTPILPAETGGKVDVEVEMDEGDVAGLYFRGVFVSLRGNLAVFRLPKGGFVTANPKPEEGADVDR